MAETVTPAPCLYCGIFCARAPLPTSAACTVVSRPLLSLGWGVRSVLADTQPRGTQGSWLLCPTSSPLHLGEFFEVRQDSSFWERDNDRPRHTSLLAPVLTGVMAPVPTTMETLTASKPDFERLLLQVLDAVRTSAPSPPSDSPACLSTAAFFTVWAAHIDAAVTHPSGVRARRLALAKLSFSDLLDADGDVCDLCASAIASGLVLNAIGKVSWRSALEVLAAHHQTEEHASAFKTPLQVRACSSVPHYRTARALACACAACAPAGWSFAACTLPPGLLPLRSLCCLLPC